MTYVALANITLGSSASSVTFSSIPNTFRDLVLVIDSVSAAGGAFNTGMRFNGDSGSNYGDVFMFGDGSSAASGAGTPTSQGITFTSSVRSNSIAQIMDYSATDKHKPTLCRYNAANVQTVARAFRWANTAAVTSIFLFNASANGETFGSGSSFALYGIRS